MENAWLCVRDKAPMMLEIGLVTVFHSRARWVDLHVHFKESIQDIDAFWLQIPLAEWHDFLDAH